MSKDGDETEDTGLMLDVGQANELKMAFRRCRWTNAEIKEMSKGDFLKGVRQVLMGIREIMPIQRVDLDANPRCPAGWSVVEHRKGGKIHPAMIVGLYRSQQQLGRKRIVGSELRKELADKPVLNANLLDFYLANPDQIPGHWKGKRVFFWGTIYRDSDGQECVRYLYLLDGQWAEYWRWLIYPWESGLPALVFAGP